MKKLKTKKLRCPEETVESESPWNRSWGQKRVYGGKICERCRFCAVSERVTKLWMATVVRRQGETHTHTIIKHCPAPTCNVNKAIVRLHFARAAHSRHPFPPIGDAAYRQHAGGRPSHGHRQRALKNLVKIAHVVPEISSWTDRHTHHNTSQPLPRAK